MKLNLQFFAEDRTNMVSLLDVGSLDNGQTPSILEMGDGFTEFSEDWGPDIGTTQYVNMKAKSSTLKGYEFSMTPEREYMSDAMQAAIDKLFKDFPTGSKAQTYYYRFYKTDLTTEDGSSTGDCIRVPVIVAPSSVGGAGGDTLTSSIQISGNGNAEKGTITITVASGGEKTYSWVAAAS